MSVGGRGGRLCPAGSKKAGLLAGWAGGAELLRLRARKGSEAGRVLADGSKVKAAAVSDAAAATLYLFTRGQGPRPGESVREEG